ncbi:hypothetical protein SEA_KEELAN_71 [Gordonia phage Keelan]|nr:hypothetical protein SEA_KEELAN_71 [Gordonia phage Keelan]
MSIVVIRESDGSIVRQGDSITNFRDEEYTFKYGSRGLCRGKSGKVTVQREGAKWSAEYYDSVFDCCAVDLSAGNSRELVAERYGTESKVYEAFSRAIDAEVTAEIQQLLTSNPWQSKSE